MQEKVSILKLNDKLQTKNKELIDETQQLEKDFANERIKNKKLIDDTQKLEKDFLNERIKNKNLEIKHRIEI